MTAIDFPNNPNVNDTFTVGQRTWKWTGTSWDVVPLLSITGMPTGGSKRQILAKNSTTDFDNAWVSQSYNHNQNAVSSIWTINHNLGFFPNIVVKDSGGTIVEGDINFVDANNVTITFSAAFSGNAYLS